MSTKEEIFNYVTTTPENTNPAVVRSLLNNLETGRGTFDPLVIEIEYGSADPTHISTTTTCGELKEAAAANKPVFVSLLYTYALGSYTRLNLINGEVYKRIVDTDVFAGVTFTFNNSTVSCVNYDTNEELLADSEPLRIVPVNN